MPGPSHPKQGGGLGACPRWAQQTMLEIRNRLMMDHPWPQPTLPPGPPYGRRLWSEEKPHRGH